MADIAPFAGHRIQPEKAKRFLTPFMELKEATTEVNYLPISQIPWNCFLQEETKCFYGYRVNYRTDGGLEKNRTGFIGRLNPFEVEKREVVPVVDSTPELIEKSIKEIQATNFKSGIVVAAYEDTQFEIEQLLVPDILNSSQIFDFNGETHTIWPITNKLLISELTGFFSDRKCFPFEGVHYFKASRRLYNMACAKDSGINREDFYPLTLFLNIYDFGVNLDAYQYLVPKETKFDINKFILKCDPYFEAQTYHWNSAEEKKNSFCNFQEDFRIQGTTDVAIGAYFPGESQFFLFSRRPQMNPSRFLPPDVSSKLYDFSAIYLKRLFIENFYWNGNTKKSWDNVLTIPEMKEALNVCEKNEYGAVFFLMAPNKRNLIKLAKQGGRLPDKAVRLNPQVPYGLIADKLQVYSPTDH